MTEVKIEDLLAFIKSKGDQPVDMSNCHKAKGVETCGCLFVQYLESLHPDFIYIGCSFKTGYVRVLDPSGLYRTIGYLFPVSFSFFGLKRTFNELCIQKHT